MDIINTLWAILPSTLQELLSLSNDIDALNHLAPNVPKTMEASGDVAIIPIHGVITKHENIFTRLLGGTSSTNITNEFIQALSDPDVKQIVLDIDSPGGQVNGTQELANIIFEGRDKKPIIAFANGTMASAAVWIGAAAHQIFISGDTTVTGSIGVVATHTDISKAEEKAGVKTTEILAGQFKRIASRFEPLTKEGRQEIQAQVDAIYSVFVADIAKFRGTTVENVLENMADGRIFIGKKAVESGLVDGVSTLDRVVFSFSTTSTADHADISTAPDRQPIFTYEETIMKDLDETEVERLCKKTWETNKKIREEFGSFDVYLAFSQAENNGQVNLLSRVS